MTTDFSRLALLVVAGGRSSRMHEDKRRLEINGVGLLENILRKAEREHFAEIFLCVEGRSDFLERLATKFRAELLIDRVSNVGPIAGLVNGLSRISTDWALIVSCDQPFLELDVLRSIFEPGGERIILPKAGGRVQTLAGFYHRSTVGAFEESMKCGVRKLRRVIERLPHRIVELDRDEIFFNVNAPSELRLARGRAANLGRRLPIVSIVAPKSGTGKTTFIERLIPKLNARGLRVGVIKSDAHGFDLDVEGKDSERFRRAGATSTAVVSPRGWFLVQSTSERVDFMTIAERMTDVDLILIETRAHGVLPSLSLYRGLGAPLINEDVVAIFADRSRLEPIVEALSIETPSVDPPTVESPIVVSPSVGAPIVVSPIESPSVAMLSPSIKCFDLDDIDSAVELCLFFCKGCCP